MTNHVIGTNFDRAEREALAKNGQRQQKYGAAFLATPLTLEDALKNPNMGGHGEGGPTIWKNGTKTGKWEK